MDEFFKPEIIVLYCGYGLADGEHLPEGVVKSNGCRARFVMMPCSCKVESGYLLKLFEGGADGVTMIGCPEEKCQFMIGSIRARNRVNYTKYLLAEAGLDQIRLTFIVGENLSTEKYYAIAQSHAGVINTLGPNPVKVVSQIPK